MVRELSEPAKAVIFLVCLGVAIAGLYSYVQAIQPPPVRPAGLVTVRLVVDAGSWNLSYGPVATANNTPFSLLLEASHRLGFTVREVYYTVPSAVFVTAINGTANGQGGHFWQYWVNGVYGDVGADHYALQSGDFVLWRFATDQGEMGG